VVFLSVVFFALVFLSVVFFCSRLFVSFFLYFLQSAVFLSYSDWVLNMFFYLTC